MGYDFNVIYKPGLENKAENSLSRMFEKEELTTRKFASLSLEDKAVSAEGAMIEHLLGKGREHRSEFNRATIWRVYSTKKKVDPAGEQLRGYFSSLGKKGRLLNFLGLVVL